jgi:hypothetical protein
MIISQKSCRLWDDVEKFGTTRKATDGNMVWRRKDAIFVQDNQGKKNKDTHW